jgi:hypothetical protein|nr:MAG TPA: hypothetical protein [Caudoviricetes sp.]
METIFKIGMKVYDQVFFPNRDGKIVQIYNKSNRIQIEVKFFSNLRLEPLCMQDSVFYTEKGNMINFCAGINCETSTLSTEPYKVELQGFEQKAPVPTFEDAIKWLQENNKYDVSISDDSTVTYFTKKENYSAFEALRKLVILRDYYNEGWEPDWEDGDEYKYCIKNFGNELYTIDLDYSARVMTFKTPEIRDKFLEEQRELLEIAKPLL